MFNRHVLVRQQRVTALRASWFFTSPYGVVVDAPFIAQMPSWSKMKTCGVAVDHRRGSRLGLAVVEIGILQMLTGPIFISSKPSLMSEESSSSM
jgi:hypothetical protein